MHVGDHPLVFFSALSELELSSDSKDTKTCKEEVKKVLMNNEARVQDEANGLEFRLDDDDDGSVLNSGSSNNANSENDARVIKSGVLKITGKFFTLPRRSSNSPRCSGGE